MDTQNDETTSGTFEFAEGEVTTNGFENVWSVDFKQPHNHAQPAFNFEAREAPPLTTRAC
ncbi:MAG: hypothetical protein OXI80_08215 [Caldilineaceae bacterium]|nr:hypothetical protein [Caldilineaceae bacterium]MDE0337642.1 hypothetical protein [Caldilineaceae bacterium]